MQNAGCLCPITLAVWIFHDVGKGDSRILAWSDWGESLSQECSTAGLVSCTCIARSRSDHAQTPLDLKGQRIDRGFPKLGGAGVQRIGVHVAGPRKMPGSTQSRNLRDKRPQLGVLVFIGT